MEILELLQKGGPVFWILGFCSLAALFFIIEKSYQFHRARVDVAELVLGLVNVLKRDGMTEAITLCDASPGPVSRILTSAIQAYQSGDDIKKSIESQALVELPRLESRLNILQTIAFISPLLGLLGTVLAMWRGIGVMSGSDINTSELMKCVSESLVFTACGISLSIVCYVAYNCFAGRVAVFCNEMEKASSEIIYFFEHHKRETHSHDKV